MATIKMTNIPNNDVIIESLMTHANTDLIFIIDRDFNLIQSNASFKAYVKENENNDVESGNNFFDLINDKTKHKKINDLFTTVLKGEEVKRSGNISDNDRKIFEISMEPLRQGDKIIGILCVMHPSHSSLVKDSHKEGVGSIYKSLVQVLPDSIFIINLEGIIREFSLQSIDLFEATISSEMVGKNIFDFVAPREKGKLKKRINSAIKTGFAKRIDLTYIKLNTDRFVGASTMALLKNHQGTPDAIIMIIRDVTEIKENAEELKRTKGEFVKMVNSLPNYVWTSKIFENGQVLYNFISPIVEQITGYSQEFFTSDADNILKIVHPDDISIVSSNMEKINRGYNDTIEYEYRIIHANKKTKWLNTKIVIEYLSTGYRQIIGITTDISKRKVAEIALEISERKYRLISENTTDVIWTMDLDRKISYVSPSIFNLAGYTTAEIHKVQLAQFFTPPSLKTFNNALTIILGKKTVRTPLLYQLEFIRKNGSHGWCEVKLNFLKHGNKVIGILGAIIDISKRKDIEQALMSNEREANQFLYNANYSILTINPDGEIIEMNNQEAFPGIKVSNNESIYHFISKDNFSTNLESFFNESQTVEQNFEYKEKLYKLISLATFKVNKDQLGKFLLFDQSAFELYKKTMLENLSMLQLIMWT